ncbi:MAG: hypothetical protein ACE5GP_19605, partial [Salmonella enterica]
CGASAFWRKICALILLLCVNFRNPPHFVLIWPLMVAIQTACKKIIFIRCNVRGLQAEVITEEKRYENGTIKRERAGMAG